MIFLHVHELERLISEDFAALVASNANVILEVVDELKFTQAGLASIIVVGVESLVGHEIEFVGECARAIKAVEDFVRIVDGEGAEISVGIHEEFRCGQKRR